MPGLLSSRQDEGVDFELFSNTVLKFTSILMVVLVLLAINVGQKLEHIISSNRFSGGSARPQLYFGVYRTNNLIENGSESPITVVLESPSFAQTPTKVTEAGTIAIHETDTFSGRYVGSIYRALSLLSGIAPGSMVVDGKETPFVVPKYSTKFFHYQDKNNRTVRVPSTPEVAERLLRLWSDIYKNPLYPLRAFSEFRNSKTRVYVETAELDGRHTVSIGHVNVPAWLIKSGVLDFLTGLSSTDTEVIYLGNSIIEPQANTRLDFFETHGFVDTANDLRTLLFPDIAELDLVKNYFEKSPTWDLLTTNIKNFWLNHARGDADIARKRYEVIRKQEAFWNYKNQLLVKALTDDMTPEASALPPTIAHPKAWQAYVDYRLKSNPIPPEWFVTEFLQPLGFDKRVTIIQ